MRRYLFSLVIGLVFACGLFVFLGLEPAMAQETASTMESFAETAGFTTGADISTIIARLIRTFLGFLGVVAVSFMLYGGFLWMTSGGNPERVTRARNVLINAMVGLVITLSAFAITQFVINALTEATESSIITDEDDYEYPDVDSGDTPLFYLASLNTECAEYVKNLELQFVFSQAVSSSTIEDGIKVSIDGGDEVSGTFTTSGSTVRFVPDTPCSDDADSYCFETGVSYAVTVFPSALRSSRGSSLVCSASYPCSHLFTIGSDAGVDTAGPDVTMNAPEDDGTVYAYSIPELLQAMTDDDLGVSTVDFYVDDEEVFNATLFSSTEAGISPINYFNTDTSAEWNTSGYITNETYGIYAVGSDCSGNTDRSPEISVVLRSATCKNLTQDVDLGETDVDCGGDSSSQYYCGSCEAETCSTDSDCSSGVCESGVCVNVPQISSVSPGNGAPGNLITIFGSGFGDTSGEVTFIGDDESGSVTVSSYLCDGEASWSDQEIIVEIPEGAGDGPIEVETASGEADRTDDESGAYISDFDVNAIERPGLCSIEPAVVSGGVAAEFAGKSFGDSIGTSSIYFHTTEATSYLEPWTSTALNAVAPSLSDGTYYTQVFRGDYYCENSGAICVADEDCDTATSESCVTSWCSETLEVCSTSDDCEAEDAGRCEPIRQGSNRLLFSSMSTATETTPVISYVDSGWQACSGGTADGAYCADSLEDCGTGTCESQSDWGPSGQYITIFGSDFGTAEGVVYFVNQTGSALNDVVAIGRTDFPESCGEEYWSDTAITVKVPDCYTTSTSTTSCSPGTTVEEGLHAIYITRGSDGASSATEGFAVVSGEPTASICLIEPSSGPVGIEVDFYGENFSTASGGVVWFYEDMSVEDDGYDSWENTEIINVTVPDSTQTGAVYLVTGEGEQSNAVSFEIGDCREDADFCGAEEECCGDGSCRSVSLGGCPDLIAESHYAFSFTTEEIFPSPQVEQDCDAGLGIASPSPWEGWSSSDDVCVNAAVSATFDTEMDAASLNSSTILVEKCAGDDLREPCGETEPFVMGGEPSVGTHGFIYDHFDDFETGVTYRVTLVGGSGADVIRARDTEGGMALAADYQWEFTTTDDDTSCEVGDVYVEPGVYTSLGSETISYLSELVSTGDECVLLSCAGETIYWESSDGAAIVSSPETLTGSCEQTVMAVAETPAGDPAEITATVTSASGNPSGEGELIIDYSDPEVEDVAPQCSSACLEAAVYATFNTAMDTGTFSSSNVKLYACEDSLCSSSELTEITGVSITATSDYKVTIDTSPAYLEPDTYYRAWLSGAIASSHGVLLSSSGSNFGTSDNGYYANDYSWIFKTKTEDDTCVLDRIDIVPDEVVLSVVGDHQDYEAVPYAAPDECSTTGQALQASAFTWETWVSSVPTVAALLDAGAISLSTDIPSYCTTACLNAGSSIGISSAICGDGIIDYDLDGYGDAEDCDGEAACSDSCLWEGTEACGYSCATSGLSCSTDSDCSTFACQVSGLECATDSDCSTYACEISGNSCVDDDDCDTATGELCLEISSEICVETTDTCDIVAGGCCGDGVVDDGEDCDDGAIDSDGCSASCQNVGSSSVGATCGDGILDYAPDTGGEDCDDGNTTGGDGCSANCLHEGAVLLSDIVSTCGDGSVDDGEDCDDLNDTDGDGCSSSCLFEGASVCVYACYDGLSYGVNCLLDTDCATGETCEAVSTPCCGDGIADYDADGINEYEDCDDGNALSGDGCSSQCLNEGASTSYDVVSYCGDGVDSEFEECETESTSFSTSAFATAEVAETAPEQVDETTGYAVTTIIATADGVSGEGLLSVECSCETDYQCGSPESAVGCGTGGCCFDRMIVGPAYPETDSEDQCQNVAVWVEFDQQVLDSSLDPSVDTDGDGEIESDEYIPNIALHYTGSDCPDTYLSYTIAQAEPGTILARAWQFVRTSLLWLFGQEVLAETTYCLVPGSLNATAADAGGDRVQFSYNTLLEEGEYEFVVFGDTDIEDGDKEGVLSAYGVSLEDAETIATSFTVGSEVCDLDYVIAEDQGIVDGAFYEDPSSQYFTEIGEVHHLMAAGYHLDGAALTQLEPTDAYDWEWGWSTNDTSGTIMSVEGTDDEALATAEGQDGTAQVIATATIITDISDESVGTTVTDALVMEVFLCENPWVSDGNYTYQEEVTNFSFYYCRDAGIDGTSDDLPLIGDVDGLPIDVTPIASSSIYKEVIFQVDGTSDAIGVRVVPNETYLSPSAWYEAQGFTGSYSETTVDGYEAVKDGVTYYVLAANQDGSTLYPNIYVISYNENAGAESVDIFEELIDNISFNANTEVVTNLNLCAVSETYYSDADGEYLSCSWDGECVETCESGICSLTGEACEIAGDCPMAATNGPVCDAEKQKLTRDLDRLTDITDVVSLIETYGTTNAHCSVSTDVSCVSDTDCSGSETCVADVPMPTSGTYIPAISVSAWPSWVSVMGNTLGETLPTDPLNAFYECAGEGYDSASCWNGDEGLFTCADGSHVYGYRGVGGESYELYAQLEYNEGAWAYDIDVDSTDISVIEVEYSGGYTTSSLMSGFLYSTDFCDGSLMGSTGSCGDGIINGSEACEIGDVSSDACTDPDTGAAGVATVTCLDTCLSYQTGDEAVAAGATCAAYSCGNGIVESENGEECDDGSFNGSYGYCGADCLLDSGFYCGDGYLAGGEQCDCGTVTTLSDLSSDAASWAYNNCDLSGGGTNGQYVVDTSLSCAFDCTAPGPSCGDGEINGAEECDGDYEEWEGAICANGDMCETDADCTDGSTCGSRTRTAACSTSQICEDYDNAGGVCDNDADCDISGRGNCVDGVCESATDVGYLCSGDVQCDSWTCSTDTYQTYRYRTCNSSTCDWDSWSRCVGGDQQCGNGILEGDEVCDDGNDSNNDACLNTCTYNTCGDDYVYTGVESCDRGSSNGEVCSSTYGGTCQYCTTTCEYMTRSGSYCGDGTINGSEVCDGSEYLYRYFDEDTRSVSGTCSPSEVDTDDGAGYTCRDVGVCSGGEDNGEYCTAETSGDDTQSCAGSGVCVAPSCASDCGSTCPFTYETASVLVQSEAEGSSLGEAVELYSYLSGYSPDNALMSLPACSVGVSLEADIDATDVPDPDVDVVFVADLSSSMGDSVGGTTYINIAVETLKDAVASLFDSYSRSSATLRVGLVYYNSQYDDGGTMLESCSTPYMITGTASYVDAGVDVYSENGYVFDVDTYGGAEYLYEYGDENDLLSSLEGHVSCAAGGTNTFQGVYAAGEILRDAGSDVKIIVLLTDGEPSYHPVDYEGGNLANTSCDGFSYSYEGTTYSDTQACVAEIRDLLDTYPGIDVYTATISSEDDSSLVSYATHLSEEECVWDSLTDVDDCSFGAYAFQGDSEEEIADMYETVVSAITGGRMTLITEEDGSTVTTSGAVGDGVDQTLPFPDGFECQSEDFTIPMRIEFYGEGALGISNVEFEYCPIQ